jgi:predicted kinase
MAEHPFIDDLRRGPQPFAACVEALGGTLDLLPQLEKTPQDPAWHGEGDVAAHVTLVLEALERELETTDLRLEPRQRLAVRLAALLHDIAKPLTTRTEVVEGQERVVSPHHTGRGVGYLAFRLPELGLSPDVYLEVLGLVRNHHRPQFLLHGDDPLPRVRGLSRRVPLQRLFLLGLADARGRKGRSPAARGSEATHDTARGRKGRSPAARGSEATHDTARGRVAADTTRLEEGMLLFRLACEESGAWQGSARAFGPFAAAIRAALPRDPPHLAERAVVEGLWDLDHGRITCAEEALARQHDALQEPPPRVVLTCGPSGSGKSRWVEQHREGMTVISLDELRREVTGDRADQGENRRVFKLARKRLREQLRAGGDVIWDATSLRRDMRSGVLQTARSYGAHTTLVVLCPALSTIRAGNRHRSFPVPEPVLRRQLEVYQWAEADEAHRTIYVDGDRVLRDTRGMWGL